MATQVSAPIRLVKCPRCRKLLQELPEVPVYKCGGCGTVLQAKVRKPETKHTGLPSQETDSAGENLHCNVLGQTEGGSSNGDLSDSPKVECSPDDDKIQRGDECDGSVELSHNEGASDGLSGSSVITSARSESSPSKDQESVENFPLIRSPQKYRSKSGEWAASPNELPSSGEISLEAEAYISEASEHTEQHDQSLLHLGYSIEQTQDGESKWAQQEGDNHVDEVQNFSKVEDQESVFPRRIKDDKVVPENEEMRTFLTERNGESSDKIKHVGPDSASEIISHENGITSSTTEVVHDGSKGLPLFRKSTTEKSTSPKASVGAPRSPSKGSLVSFYLTSDDERLEHPQREAAHRFERFSSMDVSEHKFGHRSAACYPTSRSYYACDGSESSYDEIDDQVHEHIAHPSRKDKDVGHTRTREELGGDTYSEAERTYRAIHPSWNRVKSPEVNRYTARNGMRYNAREDVSRLQFPSDHANGRGPAGISGDNWHNLLPALPALNLSDKSVYSDPEKVDLLMTVCHLKDQLQRMHFNPLPYNLLGSERDIYGVSHQGRYNRRCDNANGFDEGYNEQRMAFSGEAAHFRHQAISCLHCSPQDRHYSAQLPSCSMHRMNGHRVMHTEYNCCDRSCFSSPHRYANSESSSWGCEAKPDNKRLDEIKQLREKYNMGKRHLRPLAGGAPVIACYHCSELLQLPADFLLFNKRYHQLRCNACRKVLKFSFHKGTRLVPYIADASAPPPSEVGDYNDTASHGQRNVEPVSSHSISCPHVESLSCSDDFGRSLCRSCSTEGEAPLVSSSLDRAKRDSYSGKTSSGKLKGIWSEPQMKNEGSMESVKSVGPSSRNVTRSEIEELPPLANSPLHRLMGYSSPSKVFKR